MNAVERWAVRMALAYSLVIAVAIVLDPYCGLV